MISSFKVILSVGKAQGIRIPHLVPIFVDIVNIV